MKYGIIWQPGAWWIGGHWSNTEKRLCITLIPMLTCFITFPGGAVPSKKRILWQSHDSPLRIEE